MKRTALLILLAYLLQANILRGQGTGTKYYSLQDIIYYALENNPQLIAANQNSDVARNQVQIVKGSQLPSISGLADYGFTNEYKDLDDYNSINAGVQINQTIWQNGKTRMLVKEAELNSEVIDYTIDVSRNDLIFNIKKSYISVLRLTNLERISKQLVSQSEITLEAAKERFEVGITKRSDVLKAETEYSNALYTSVQFETSRKNAQKELLNLAGFELDRELNLIDFLNNYEHQFNNYTVDKFISNANQNLPEIIIANKLIEQQNISILAEQKSIFPQLGLYINYSWVDNPVISNDFIGSAGLNLRVNLFSGFQQQNKIKIEKVRLVQRKYEKTSINSEIELDIRKAVYNLKESRQQIDYALKQLESSKENLEMTNEEYKQGLSSMIELIDAQNNHFLANQNFINAISNFQVAIILLERRSGINSINQ